MATTIPATNVKFSQLQSAYGGSNPISLSEYYRGGGIVDFEVGSPTIPSAFDNSPGANVPIKASNFSNTTAWTRSYLTIGDTTNGLMYGSHSLGGGNDSGSLYYDMSGNAATYGFWISNGSSLIAQVTTGSLSGSWFPLIPTLYSSLNNSTPNAKSRYALGTGDVSPYADADTTFCWRHPNSSWTNTMVTNMLGFNSTQLSRTQRATMLWWEYALAGMDNQMSGGFAVLSASVFNASGAQACWNNRSPIYLHLVVDTGGEWQQQGWQYLPTVTGITVTNNGISTATTSYGAPAYYYPSARTFIGATSRAADYDLSPGGGAITSNNNSFDIRNPWTLNIGTDDLVIPMMKSDNGFSGGAFNGARNPLTARFGFIAAT